MATKGELLTKARQQQLDVHSGMTKAELEHALSNETVTVNENREQEAVHGTTKEGTDTEVKNTDSVPQNGVTEIETTDQTDSKVAEAADAARTEEEVTFADESNPNQKARTQATDNAQYDQTGNPRTGGKSYGVAADDPNAGVPVEENQGEPKDDVDYQTSSFLNTGINAQEWSEEDQLKLAESLSDESDNIKAVVSTTLGDYVRIKFYRRGMPFGVYRSRSYNEADVRSWLADRKKEAGL